MVQVILCTFCIANSFLTLLRAFSFAYGGLQAAVQVHNTLVNKIINAPVLFFDQTPGGRILNRLEWGIALDHATCVMSYSFSYQTVFFLYWCPVHWFCNIFTLHYCIVQVFFRSLHNWWFSSIHPQHSRS